MKITAEELLQRYALTETRMLGYDAFKFSLENKLIRASNPTYNIQFFHSPLERTFAIRRGFAIPDGSVNSE
ncbi:MAG: hypothetical protein AAF316_06535 [Cyanobacteria bacterium P01_A01_bin.80]